jgi:hypothetical protein
MRGVGAKTASVVRRPAPRSAKPQGSGRYVQQFQLALLELERTRRHEERRAASRRVAELDARLADLETKIAERLGALGLSAGKEA